MWRTHGCHQMCCRLWTCFPREAALQIMSRVDSAVPNAYATVYGCIVVYAMLMSRAGNKNNLLVMTGYCVQGTLGHAVVMGQRDAVPIGDGETIDVKCAVRNISFRYVLRLPN